MSKYVLDASALLASLHSEIGFEIVDLIMPESSISTYLRKFKNQSKKEL
jgi:PIN domain nuclease of toxin-antitoxin system